MKTQLRRLRAGHHSYIKVYVDHSNFIKTWNGAVHGRDRPLEHDIDWQMLSEVLLEETGEWLTKARKAPQALLYRGMHVYGTLFEDSYFTLLETMLRHEQTAPNKLSLPIRLRKETIDRWREENEQHKLELTRQIRNVTGCVMVPIYRRTPREDLVEITEAEEPILLAFVRQVAADAGAPRPHKVFLSARVNAAVFYNKWKDLQGTGTDPNGNFYRTTLGDVSTKGAEVEARFVPSGGLEFFGQLSLLSTAYGTVTFNQAALCGNLNTSNRKLELKMSPPYSYQAGVVYTRPFARGRLVAGGALSGKGRFWHTSCNADTGSEDGFKLIEINSCSVSTEMWNYWPERYARSYSSAILQTLKRLDTVPRFSQLRRLAQRADNDQSAVVLKERRGEGPSPPAATDNAPAVKDAAPSAELAFFNDLAKTERLPQPMLIQFWQSALADLLRHAYQTTPFYKERLSPLLAHDGTIEWSRWFDLPVIRFADIARLRHAMLSRGIPSAHGSVSPSRVIGPAGELAIVSKSSLQLGAESCIRARLCDWHGIDRAAALATLLPRSALLPDERESWVPKWRPGPHGVHRIGDAESPAEQQRRWLSDLGPVVLRTAPALLRRLVGAFGSETDPRIQVKRILTEGETVTEDDRRSCRDVFRTEIIDAYALPEAGIVAIQCPATGNYHIQSEVCLVEVLDKDHRPCGPDGVGEITITPIYGFAMPLIRYATGAYAQLLSGSPNATTACECGRGLPSFRRVLSKPPDR